MPFKKGHSGNSAGKPKGTANKNTTDLREWITNFIEGNTLQMETDWKALEPKDRFQMFEKLLKFTLPTLQATTIETTIPKEKTKIDYSKLSTETLEAILAAVVPND